MPNDQFATFTDRREAINLFDYLRGRDPSKPWPLLPILAYIAPGGSGKSSLIEYLRAKCSLPYGRAALPYVQLDFTQTDAPKTLLSILVAMRNQLQYHDDGQDRHLTFPRFDLGAAIALASPADGNLPLMSKEEVERNLKSGSHLIEALGQWGDVVKNATSFIPVLSSVAQFIPPLLVGLKLFMQIPPVQELLQRMERGPGWKWYQAHSIDLDLPANANIKEVLLRLYDLSMPGKPDNQGKEYLIGQLLPAAFVADLRDSLVSSDAPRAWSNTANVVFFLDGYEILLDDPGHTGIQLLEALTLTEHRMRGETDPRLIVIGSRRHPFEHKKEDQNQSSEPAHQDAQDLFEHWKQQLPEDRSYLELGDLNLTMQLQDFGLDDTRNFLVQLSKQRQAQAFTNDALVQAIHRVTFGHPLSVALAAEAVLAAKARHQELSPDKFGQAMVSRKIVSGHGNEQIGDYLLSLFLGQLLDTEQNKLILCAVPRTLDVNTLRTVLQLSSDLETQQRWTYYRSLTFVRAIDTTRIVLHPIVRMLLLQRLPQSREADSDYYRIHTRLREYFDKRASVGDEQASIEHAYHALALGDSEPAVALGIDAQQRNIVVWEPLIEMVAQAPLVLMSSNAEQQAYDALMRAEQDYNLHDITLAIILYTWLVSTFHNQSREVARLQQYIGNAYWYLPGGDRQANLERAIACYEAALEVRTREAFPVEWATTQDYLGSAYKELPGGDRQANLERAIACYEAAMEVRTREAFPAQWAMTQNNVGAAFWYLPGGDRQANLERAIACYQAVLEIYTREAFPVDWAMTQNNLGAAYSDLPRGDRQANLERAIACFEAVLEIYTREASPVGWATVQHNLGIAYNAKTFSWSTTEPTPEPSSRFIPIPVPQPVDCTLHLTTILGSDRVNSIQISGQIVFHAVGDTGGIVGTAVQEAIAQAMEAQFTAVAAGAVPAFFYHLGDVVFYRGESSFYKAQFYEPYKNYPAVIFAIPGNHDGNTITPEQSLYGFFQNFCAPQSTFISEYRATMTQPYVYWTLEAPFVTIIGLYSNIGGTLDGPGTAVQQQWLISQLQNADPSTCIIVAIHQPPYSLDANNLSSPSIGVVIDQAAAAAGVWPHAVFSSHVHNYQRFTHSVLTGGQERVIPYLVAGAGGWANFAGRLHKLQRDAARNPVPCPFPTSSPGVELRGYNEIDSGFLRVIVTSTELTVEYYTVPFNDPVPTSPFDAVTLNYQTGTITSEMNPGTSGAAS